MLLESCQSIERLQWCYRSWAGVTMVLSVDKKSTFMLQIMSRCCQGPVSRLTTVMLQIMNRCHRLWADVSWVLSVDRQTTVMLQIVSRCYSLWGDVTDYEEMLPGSCQLIDYIDVTYYVQMLQIMSRCYRLWAGVARVLSSNRKTTVMLQVMSRCCQGPVRQ